MMKNIRTAILSIVLVIAAIGVLNHQFREKPAEMPPSSDSGDIPLVPVKGKVTMLDLGATECIPCKMMAPIMAELEKEYQDKASIIFIDVWKHPDQAKKFGIRAIPTQIFFDKDGKEAFRHTGFMDKKTIIEKLKLLGVS